MALDTSPPATAPAPTSHARHRGQGQWALGHLEPLTPNERVKKDDDGLNVRARVENIYAKAGFASIDPADLRGRLRWWGLYTQRRPGIDGGKTADPRAARARRRVLHAADPHRRRAAQHRAAARRSPRSRSEFGRDTADVTDRQNIQLHWIRIEDVPEIWRRLEAVGLSTTEACGDTPRVILGSPVAGIAADEIIDGTPAITAIHRALHRLAGVLQPAPQVQDGDQRLARAGRRARGQRHLVHRRRAPRARTGLRPLGRRRAVDQPDAGPAARCVRYRSTRSRTSGPASSACSATTATDGCAPGPGSSSSSPTGASSEFRRGARAGVPRPRADRRPGSRRCPTARATTSAYTASATAATTSGSPRPPGGSRARSWPGSPTSRRQHGSQRVRTTPHQKLIVLDVAADRVDSLVAAADAPGPARPARRRSGATRWPAPASSSASWPSSRPRPAPPRSSTSSSAGCPTSTSRSRINVNGCPNSCARDPGRRHRPQGQLVLDADRNQVEGFQVHLGGGLGLDAGFGRKLRGHKITADEVPDYVERVVRNFDEQRHTGERFAQWVARADEGALT